MSRSAHERIPIALLSLRLGVFSVMLIWTLDKFLNPKHASAVYTKFYYLGGLAEPVLYLIGVLELLIIVGFVVGFRKRLTYGAVFLFHAISTLSSYKQYLAPFSSMLFWAAWPMLAACFTLYILRDLDTLWVVDRND